MFRLTPSPASIMAGYKNYTAGYELADLTLVMCRQTDTLFKYSINDKLCTQSQRWESRGNLIVFLMQVQNINLGMVMPPANSAANSTNSNLAPNSRVTGLRSDQKKLCYPLHLFQPLGFKISFTWQFTWRVQYTTHYMLSLALALVNPID